MLSDEEKQAVDYLIFHKYENSSKKEDMIDKVIEIIEKQSKEIEELKNKNKKLQDKCKELIFEKQELTSALLDSTPDDKIKAKIEELEKMNIHEFETMNVLEVLQSLLERSRYMKHIVSFSGRKR